MADHSSQSSHNPNYRLPISSFFGSAWFEAFTTKILSEIDSAITPLSILSKVYNPLWYDKNNPKFAETFSGNQQSWENLGSKGIGLALVDTLLDDTTNSRKVLFAAELKITNSMVSDSPKSASDFGTKTRNSQFLEFGSAKSGIQTSLSMTEMENSEDYTCVIARGPNPRTTHIFDDCIVEESYISLSDNSDNVSESFLSICCTCNKNLEQKNQIYIYRGEKAFCSTECCYQEMLFDGMDNSQS